MEYVVLGAAALMGLSGTIIAWIVMAHRTSPMTDLEIDAWQCENWRSEGKTEEDIKTLCDIFDMVYDPP